MDFLSVDYIFPMVALGAIFVIRILPRIQASRLGVKYVDPHDVKGLTNQGQDVLVVDVRSPSEFQGPLGHIPGALNLDAVTLRSSLEMLDRHKEGPTLVTCRSTNRSPGAALFLAKNGFKQVMILQGGMSRWNGSGYPTQ